MWWNHGVICDLIGPRLASSDLLGSCMSCLMAKYWFDWTWIVFSRGHRFIWSCHLWNTFSSQRNIYKTKHETFLTCRGIGVTFFSRCAIGFGSDFGEDFISFGLYELSAIFERFVFIGKTSSVWQASLSKSKATDLESMEVSESFKIRWKCILGSICYFPIRKFWKININIQTIRKVQLTRYINICKLQALRNEESIQY